VFDATDILGLMLAFSIASAAVTSPAAAQLVRDIYLQTSEHVLSEIAQELKRNPIPAQGCTEMKVASESNFPMLLSVIIESLRLSPPALFFREKQAPPQGDMEYDVPPGTLIG